MIQYSLEYSFFFHISQKFLPNEKRILWPGGKVPPASPKCGFDNERCQLNLSLSVMAGVTALILALAVGLGFAWRFV